MAKSASYLFSSDNAKIFFDCFNLVSSFHIDDGLKCINTLIIQPKLVEFHSDLKNVLLIIQKLFKLEKTFITLDFFEKSQWFVKKDKSSLVGDYTILITDLQALNSKLNSQQPSHPSFFGNDLEIIDLVTNLHDLIEAKRSLSTFYLRLCQGYTQYSLSDLANCVKDINEKNRARFKLPIFSELKKSFHLHVTALNYLIECTISVHALKFIPSLIKLEEIYTIFMNWQGVISFSHIKRAKKSRLKRTLTHNSTCLDAPPFYKWLCQFYLFLLSKFSLYFHEVLNKNTPSSERKGLVSKLDQDFYSNFECFRAQTPDNQCIAILYDSHSINSTPQLCFMCTNDDDDDQNSDSEELRYKLVISCPQNIPYQQVNDFNSYIDKDETNSLELSDKVSSTNSSKLLANKENFTCYYKIALDSHFYLCSAHLSNRRSKDTKIQSNLEGIAKILNTDQMFYSLVVLPT